MPLCRFDIPGKFLRWIALILLSVVFGHAATIVDTGPGVSSGPGDGSCLCYDQWLGAEFTVDRPTTITHVEGWIQGLNGMTVQIRTGFDRPGQVLHEMEYSGRFSDQYRWFGPDGLGWVLRPGKYWVVFGVQQPGSGGGMANNSPRPLGREAHSSGLGGASWSVSNNLNFGIRILGETSPPTVSFENAQTFIHATNGMAELRIVADSGRTAPVVVTVRRLPGIELPGASFEVIIQPFQNLVSIPHGPLTRSAEFVLESTQIAVAEPSRVTAVYPPPRIWLCCDTVDVSANGSFATFLHTDVRVRTNLIVRGNLFDDSNRLIEPVFFALGDGAGPVIPITWTNRILLRGGRLMLTGVEGQVGASVMTQRVATLRPYVEPVTVSFSAPAFDFADDGNGIISATLSRPLPQTANFNINVKQIGGSQITRFISFPAGAVTAQFHTSLPDPATLALETGTFLAGEHPTAEVRMAPPRVILVGPVPPVALKGVSFLFLTVRANVNRTLEFYTRDLTAVAGRDYIPTNGVLPLTNFQAYIHIPVPENAVGGLSFQLVLTNAKNVVFPATNLTVTILSTPTFSQAVYFADENGDARVQVQLDHAMPFPVPFTIQVQRDGLGREFAFDFPAGRTNKELKLPLGDAARHVHELTLASAARSQSAWVMPFESTTNTSEIIVRPGPIRPGDIATITFERRGNLNKPMFFTWATEDGTARAGIDYRASQNALFFNRGERIAEIHLEIFQSDAMERRSFSLVISDSSDPETYFTNVKTELTILSENPMIVLWDSERFTVENAEAAEMLFYDTSGRTGNYEFFTSDGTARAGFDYVQTTGSMTNVADGSVRVPLIDDTVVEPVKYFIFHVIQTAPVRSTNSIKVYIGDNELGSVRDPSFQLEESKLGQSGWAVLADDRIIELWNGVARIFSKDGALVASRHLEFLENVNVDWSRTGLGLDGSVAVVPSNWENKVSGTTPIYRISADTLQEQEIEIEAGFYRVLAAAFLPGGGIMAVREQLLNDRWELVRLQPNGMLDPSYPIYSASFLPNERISRLQVWRDGVVKIGFQFCGWDCFDSTEMLIHEGKVIRATERAILPELNRWLLPDGRSLVRVYNSIRGGYELARQDADGTLDPDFAPSLLDGYFTTYVGAQSDGSVIVWSSEPFQNGAAKLLRLKSSPALQANVLVSGVNYPRTILEGQTGQLTVYRAGNSAVSLPFRINVTNSQGHPAARFNGFDRIFQIPAGQSFLHVSFAPIEDRIGKPPETFVLSAEPLAAGVAVGGVEMPVQVLDNDPGVALSVTRQPLTITFNQFAPGSYDIEASDDLVNWAPLGTRTATSQWQELPNRQSRFYRARLK